MPIPNIIADHITQELNHPDTHPTLTSSNHPNTNTTFHRCRVYDHTTKQWIDTDNTDQLSITIKTKTKPHYHLIKIAINQNQLTLIKYQADPNAPTPPKNHSTLPLINPPLDRHYYDTQTHHLEDPNSIPNLIKEAKTHIHQQLHHIQTHSPYSILDAQINYITKIWRRTIQKKLQTYTQAQKNTIAFTLGAIPLGIIATITLYHNHKPEQQWTTLIPLIYWSATTTIITLLQRKRK